MTLAHLFGLIILLIGVFMIGFGIRASQTITNQVVEGFTGRYTKRTMFYLIGGVLLVLIGGALLFFMNHGILNTPS